MKASTENNRQTRRSPEGSLADPAAGTSIEAISADFVAQPRRSVVSFPMGAELVLVDREAGTVHSLNPTAALVWQCLDGSASLEEISVDLAEGLGVPLAVVRADVVEMTRAAAQLGLLEGVRLESLSPSRTAADLAPGSFLAFEPRPSAAGAANGGVRSLVINWSGACGFCMQVLDHLVSVQSGLMGNGVDVVLVDPRNPEGTRRLLAERRLPALIVERAATSEGKDAFEGLGTPMAYLVGADGSITSPLAFGANEVVDLARSLAGEVGVDEDLGSPRFLPISSGVCLPSSQSTSVGRNRNTGVYRIGPYHVGIAADSPLAERVVPAFLKRHRVGAGAVAPENFAVVLFDPDQFGHRPLSYLLRDGQLVARSRSVGRVLASLVAELSSLTAPGEGLTRVDAVAVVVDGRAVLLPSGLRRSIDRVHPRLGRRGFALVDDPLPHIDLATGEVVVAEPTVDIDQDVLRSLNESRTSLSEPPAAEVGRYPLDAWLLPMPSGGNRVLSPGQALAIALGTMVAQPPELPLALAAFARLLQRIDTIGVQGDQSDSVLGDLDSWRTAATEKKEKSAQSALT